MRSRVASGWRVLGPGFVTGSSDDDPSGIQTYSQTGAQFGYAQLWLAAWTYPFMAAIQEICGRIGMVTGRGLAAVLREHYSRRVLFVAVSLLLIANTVNVGADLGAMAATGQMLVHAPFLVWLALIVGISLVLQVFVPYPAYARFLKYVCLVLLAYVAAAVVIHHPWWPTVAVNAIVPHMHWSHDYILNVVAVLGTTITPYCFFWQADQEAEEDIARGRMAYYGKGVPVLSARDIGNMRTDTAVGMGFSNIVQFFIVLTCASTLHQAGVLTVDTPDQAASALRPLAGDLAYLLFALGIVGVGFLAVPTLTGSASYALAEALGWKAGLGYTFRQARAFYVVIALATLVGVALNFVGIPPFRMLYYAAALNGVLAPPLMAMITLVGNNKAIMGDRTNNRFANVMGWAITAIMGACAVALIVSMVSDA
ncbi:divalent metal cation transporter [Mycobacterium sp. CBMA293]|nr:divalent metal cation transporter [Mycolicibacterium sp. CBMA 360]MUL58507.1 divalent metal cation transporter [Mycolicibacterium sp. CBMA 335]MUL73965.1 divalent metal cation transporter [Mycolicibacterium sp. CBMA 311]MUL93390.1 divalent metal cation transporter [Mycolicibacterium sp. CBMA 230]MUM04605.1 iron transporter [Mycolicibacterium sp. CBMA 213]MUM10233.1 divalent metal cation transporter [Mycolicibacterium sp. CBMA 293]